MLNFAVAWAFLASLVLSPYKHIYQWLFETVGVKGIPAYQSAIAAALINYWIPAFLMYLLLLAVRAERYLRPTKVLTTLVSVSNWALCSYVGLRVWTSTIEGGGASFALASMGIFVTAPALTCLGACTVWLAARSYRYREQSLALKDNEVGFTSNVRLAAIALLLPMVFFAVMYQSNADAIGKARTVVSAKDARFNDLCKEARIDIRRRVGPAKSVYFPMATNAFYSLYPVLDFAEERSGYPREGVVQQYRRITKKPDAPARIQFSLDFNTQMVTEALSEYEIATKILESPEDTKLGFAVIETTILDRRTKDVLAVFVEVSERTTIRTGHEKNCPVGFDAFKFRTEVPAYVLGLMDKSAAAEFEKKLERWKQQTTSSSR